MADKRIWKFPIQSYSEQRIEMPFGAKIVHAGLDPLGQPCVWAEVDSDAKLGEWVLRVYGTGYPMRQDRGEHVGTFIEGSLVWHVYARLA